MAKPPPRATVTSVAARAGVSRQTVSNVLHSPDVVQPDTRQRVQAAIDELDYRPNLAARQMRTSRSQAIAVRIMPSEDGVNAVVLDRFVHALCSAAERHSYHLVVFTAPDDGREISMYRHLGTTLNIDGFVVVGTHAGDKRVDWLTEQGIAFVAFGRPWSDGAEHSWVDVDGSAGTYQATRHLLDQGHRSIAFLGWDDSTGVGDDRESGWRRALSEVDPATDLLILRGSDSMATGAAMADQLAEHPAVSAVVCVSDSIAIGVLQRNQMLRRGLTLIGFDNTAAAQTLGLSSVAQPLEEAATQCFSLLHHRLTTDHHVRPEHPHILLEPTLKIRSPQPAVSHRSAQLRKGNS